MNKINYAFIITFIIVIIFAGELQSQVSFQTEHFKLSINQSGKVTEMLDRSANKNYLAADQVSYLLSVRRNGNITNPNSLQWRKKSSEIVLSFADKNSATIKVNQVADYISFELTKLTNAFNAELVIWGPYPTIIGDTIGEVVGVVRNKDFAIGIQALNIKTLGGHTLAESDIQPSYDVFSGGNKVDVLQDDMNKQLYRGDVAKHMPYGSSLQAYCRNRNIDRVIENWSHPRYMAPAYNEDGGVIGSKLAIFGVATPQVLPVISTIELKENLPHPMLDGVWGKQARHATESYLIIDFSEKTLHEAMSITKQAGLRYLYHGDPFETWGHFKLKNKDFPNDWASMKTCVDHANAQNIRLGVHTLSNFITTKDPYVTPVPDKRLAKVGFSQLTENIDNAAKEIAIKEPDFFNQFDNNTLIAAVVGNEIIRYEKISAAPPWKLLNCQRGAFGTQAEHHKLNDSIGKLMDHPYNVFLGNHQLDQEIAKTIARLFNETGLMQISFDGLEGCWSEGMGDYGKQLFTKTWFDNLKPELKGKVINDASNPGHYFWHVYTRMNWGEPWYAGFRESQLQLRLKNQQFYRRNLMPSMLGWFSLKAETSIEDIEWMLARGAGFDAGFGLSTSIETIKKHGRKDEVLAAIKLWEDARQQGVFTEAQKLKLQDTKNEFHLQTNTNGGYDLLPVYNSYFIHEQKLKQPGEPTYSSFHFDNPVASQPVTFIIEMMNDRDKGSDLDVSFDELSISINQQDPLLLPISLKHKQILCCDGKTIKLYNSQWQFLQTIEGSVPLLTLGKNNIVFDGKYSGEYGARIKMEIRAMGTPEVMKARNN